MLKKISTIVFISMSIFATNAFSMTVDEFNSAVGKLTGKSKDEVVKVFGKPAGYMNDGDYELFRYEGIKDPYTGKSSTASLVTLKNGKVDATHKPRHLFDKLPF